MVSGTKPNAKIYFLFEPRSYGMTRNIQPDPILDNFSHDVFLHDTPENIVLAWKTEGYTHVLLNRRNAHLILEATKQASLLEQTIVFLTPVAASKDQNYELLEIPPGVLE